LSNNTVLVRMTAFESYGSL